MAKAKTVNFRFDMSNPRANAQVEQLAGREITRINADTREAARQAILDGYAKGQSPLDIGLDLAGRIDPETGRRKGGILGMTSPQAKAASNYYDKLISGDVSGALSYQLRDKRYDKQLQKLLDTGGTVDPELATKMYGRYVDNAVKLRGQTIARTETGQAVHAASHEAFAQGLEKTGYTEQAVIRKWRTAGDAKVRDSHVHMNGQTVRGLRTPYVTGNGSKMMHPLDASLGAKAEDIINCRCTESIDIDFSTGIDNVAANQGVSDVAASQADQELAAIRDMSKSKLDDVAAGADDVLAKQLSVNDVVVDILRNGGGTMDEFVQKVKELFPDRDAKDLRNSIASAFSKLPKQRGIAIERSGGRYTLGGTTVTPPPIAPPPIVRPPPPSTPPVAPPPTVKPGDIDWTARFKEAIKRADDAIPEVDPLLDSKNWTSPVEATAGFRRKHGIGFYSTDARKDPEFVARAKTADSTFSRLREEMPNFKRFLELTDVTLGHERNEWMGVRKDAAGLYYLRSHKIELAGKLSNQGPTPFINWGGWTVGKNTLDDTFRHELGHALEQKVLNMALLKGLVPGGIARFKESFGIGTSQAMKLSKYGATNFAEYWAESFAAYSHPLYGRDNGPFPAQRIDPRLEKIFDVILKDKKV